MLIIKPTPPWCDMYNILLTLMAFWWFCRLCLAMKTLCDSDACQCDNIGKISCICKYPNQNLEISRNSVNQLLPMTSSVLVKDCDVLLIRRKSFEDLRSLLRINVVNVRNISLEEHSFSWNDSAIYETYPYNGIDIGIENSSLELPNYTFRGRIDTMVFTQVRFENIKSYAFSSLAGSKSITFRNCDFINVENQAFKKFTLDRMNIIGGRVNAILPSRTLTDISIKTEFLINGVVFNRIRSSAFRINGPQTFHIQNCYISHLEGEAFVARLRGPAFIDDNVFHAVEQGAFIGITVEREISDISGRQEFIFENNTISDVQKSSLLFDIGSFTPKLDWIYFNKICDCESVDHWISDVVMYSQNYPIDKVRPNILLDEIMSCKTDAQYMRLKDFKTGYCEEQAHAAFILISFAMVAVAVIILMLFFYAYWFRERRSRWMNVSQSSPLHEPVDQTFQQRSPCYEEPSTSRQRSIVTPDRRLYKETELQVIVECTEPLQECTSRIATERVTTRYEPVEYRSRSRNAGYRRNLLTSDL
ncbi:uncharacterized protein LOC135847379 [Planococcus citri]|uniref:uncharacterized protein LOC135847379 n=1 Tax=Planococcus citri TaxID=170843 RepID=UPI0031F88C0B